jgi:hypothetical protein
MKTYEIKITGSGTLDEFKKDLYNLAWLEDKAVDEQIALKGKYESTALTLEVTIAPFYDMSEIDFKPQH